MFNRPQVPSLPTGDSPADRFQRWVIEAVRTIWSYVMVPVFQTSTRPVASQAWAGRFIRVRDTNMPEQLQCCLRNANGAWSWAVVSISPQ